MGTRPLVVTTASFASRRLASGGAGGTTSYSTSGTSVTNGSPRSLAPSMASARRAPVWATNTGCRMPRPRWPSSRAGPSSTRCPRLVASDAEVVVAADDGADDGRLVAQAALQGDAGTNGPLAHADADVGVLFAADAAEELVQVVGDAQGPLGHGSLLARGCRRGP